MKSETKGTFRVLTWDEHTFSEIEDGPTLKRAHVVKQYMGDIEGEGILEYLFLYTDEKSAGIYGIERFTGKVNGRQGSFVFEHTGEFDNGIGRMIWDIVPKSGTGELANIQGEVRFESDMQEEYPITLIHEVTKEHALWKTLTAKRGG